MNILTKNNILTKKGAYQYALEKVIQYNGYQQTKHYDLNIEGIMQNIKKNNNDDCLISLFEDENQNNDPIMIVKYPENEIGVYFLEKENYEIAKENHPDTFSLFLMNGRFLYEKALSKGEAHLPLINVTGLA